jgi:enoyl-CoA hydratase/carnithine racemase
VVASSGPGLVVRLEPPLGFVELARPPHNFIDNAMIEAVADAYERFDQEPSCRAIVLSAQGKNFCAGADYSPAESVESSGANPVPLSLDHFFVQVMRIFRACTPVIAAVQGAAVGGGLGLAVSADFRVTCPEGRFSANFTRLGFNPGFGLPVTLPAVIGAQRAHLMFLTARRIRGEEAFAWGLADQLVARENVLAESVALAREIATNAPLAVDATRRLTRTALAERIEEQNVADLAQQHRLRDTWDWSEGIRAAAERREPRFKGR